MATPGRAFGGEMTFTFASWTDVACVVAADALGMYEKECDPRAVRDGACIKIGGTIYAVKCRYCGRTLKSDRCEGCGAHK